MPFFWLIIVGLCGGLGAPEKPPALAERFLVGGEDLTEADVETLLRVSDRYFHNGDYETCIRIHERITHLDPSNTDSWGVAAWLLWSLGRKEEALQRYLEGIQANPDRYELYFDLGFHLARQLNQPERGIPYLEKAASLPSPPLVRRSLAHAYFAAGRYSEAVAVWEQLGREGDVPAIVQNNLRKALAHALRTEAWLRSGGTIAGKPPAERTLRLLWVEERDTDGNGWPEERRRFFDLPDDADGEPDVLIQEEDLNFDHRVDAWRWIAVDLNDDGRFDSEDLWLADTDKDGLAEYRQFPQDTDGDGRGDVTWCFPNLHGLGVESQGFWDRKDRAGRAVGLRLAGLGGWLNQAWQWPPGLQPIADPPNLFPRWLPPMAEILAGPEGLLSASPSPQGLRLRPVLWVGDWPEPLTYQVVAFPLTDGQGEGREIVLLESRLSASPKAYNAPAEAGLPSASWEATLAGGALQPGQPYLLFQRLLLRGVAVDEKVDFQRVLLRQEGKVSLQPRQPSHPLFFRSPPPQDPRLRGKGILLINLTSRAAEGPFTWADEGPQGFSKLARCLRRIGLEVQALAGPITRSRLQEADVALFVAPKGGEAPPPTPEEEGALLTWLARDQGVALFVGDGPEEGSLEHLNVLTRFLGITFVPEVLTDPASEATRGLRLDLSPLPPFPFFTQVEHWVVQGACWVQVAHPQQALFWVGGKPLLARDATGASLAVGDCWFTNEAIQEGENASIAVQVLSQLVQSTLPPEGPPE